MWYGKVVSAYSNEGSGDGSVANSVVDLTIPATSYHGLATYGNVMIGNKAFEFYNEKNPEDFIQIPWEQIDHVAGSAFGGKWIARFAIGDLLTMETSRSLPRTTRRHCALCALIFQRTIWCGR